MLIDGVYFAGLFYYLLRLGSDREALVPRLLRILPAHDPQVRVCAGGGHHPAPDAALLHDLTHLLPGQHSCVRRRPVNPFS